jgi:hypothetical protein
MPRIASILCLVSMGFLASCSAFDWQWLQTEAPQEANPSALLDGKWEGTWQSDATDYAGHLQAIVVHSSEALIDKEHVQQYSATFRMRWYEVPFNEITVTLNATRMEDGRIHFEGVKYVGFVKGGSLRLDGYLFPKKNVFYCDYATEKDSGTYKMIRVLSDPEEPAAEGPKTETASAQN